MNWKTSDDAYEVVTRNCPPIKEAYWRVKTNWLTGKLALRAKTSRYMVTIHQEFLLDIHNPVSDRKMMQLIADRWNSKS